jgi:hypothetical protein
VTKDRSEVLSWLGIGKKGVGHAREQAKTSRTFASIGDQLGIRSRRQLSSALSASASEVLAT